MQLIFQCRLVVILYHITAFNKLTIFQQFFRKWFGAKHAATICFSIIVWIDFTKKGLEYSRMLTNSDHWQASHFPYFDDSYINIKHVSTCLYILDLVLCQFFKRRNKEYLTLYSRENVFITINNRSVLVIIRILVNLILQNHITLISIKATFSSYSCLK